MCNHLVIPSCFCFCTPLQLWLCCNIISSLLHFWYVHKLTSILFILSTIAHLIYSIDHSPLLLYLPSFSYSCYITVQIYFQDRFRDTILFRYIHLSTDIKIYTSKSNFANLTVCISKSNLHTFWEIHDRNSPFFISLKKTSR